MVSKAISYLVNGTDFNLDFIYTEHLTGHLQSVFASACQHFSEISAMGMTSIQLVSKKKIKKSSLHFIIDAVKLVPSDEPAFRRHRCIWKHMEHLGRAESHLLCTFGECWCLFRVTLPYFTQHGSDWALFELETLIEKQD